ncbi:hypothetical protein A1D31_39925 [Bradyrhizobium liaoningense]|nr:hypothetical protein A1D31_39925 [Bradyrhizobium liaoningense]
MLDYPCPAAFAKRLMLPVSAWSDAVIVPWLTAQGYQFVDKLGEKVSALKGGDRVFGSVPRGGLAEEVAVPAYEPEPPFSKSLTSLKLSDNGTNATADHVTSTLNSMEDYVGKFKQAFPRDTPPVTFDYFAKALKTFEATLELWRNLGDDGVRKAAYRGG